MFQSFRYDDRTPELDISKQAECTDLDDNNVTYLGQNVRRLIKDGLIVRKPVAVHSRARTRKNAEARRKVCVNFRYRGYIITWISSRQFAIYNVDVFIFTYKFHIYSV